MKTRGQSALEYMMTYSWVILIMALLGVFIWQSGVLKQSCPPGSSGFSQVRPIDWVVSNSESKIVLTLINDAGMTLHYDQINASIYGKECLKKDIGEDVRSGETKQYVLENLLCTIPTRDNCYQVDLVISYTNPVSTISHNSVGELHGMSE